MKKRKSCFIWLLCILFLVTALPAVDFTDVQAASVSSTFTGWKTSGGKKYYYKNGKKLTDLHKIGKYYYCFATDGTMLTGWHRIHNRFRYFVITYELTSMQVYKIVKPKELKGLFLPYHTMDPSQAIERILEAKGLFTDEKMELERQYEIFKRIRNKKI